MGLYATTTSLPYLLVGFLRNNATQNDEFGTTMASHHIRNAEATIHSYLGLRYAMPFSTTAIPPDVRRMAEQIACYDIIKSSTYQDPKQKNPYLEEFKQVFDQLKMLREGTMALTFTDGSLVPTLSNEMVLSSTENYTPIFGRDDARSWERDLDEENDTWGSRA